MLTEGLAVKTAAGPDLQPEQTVLSQSVDVVIWQLAGVEGMVLAAV